MMKLREMAFYRRIATGVALGFAGMAFGELAHVVTDVEYLALTNMTAAGDETVSVFTTDHGAWPSGLPTPSFHLDATDRTGWSLDGARVTNIVSKTGTRRLSSDTTGATWTGWGGDLTLLPPTLEDDAELGCKVLDFGAIGSRRGLIFDAEQAEGCTATNKLSPIGTAFFVYGSQQGGGWLFGGVDSGYEWHRGSHYAGTAVWGPYNAMAQNKSYSPAYYESLMRHNGLPFVPAYVGFTGGWEVFTFAATNAMGAAALSALGLGVGDARASMSSRSGGMKIAEMIVFSDVLTSDQIAAMEDYLQKKWFAYRRVGVNGRAQVGEILHADSSLAGGKKSVVTTCSGEDLALGLVRGGRNATAAAAKADTIQIAGSGTVTLGDFSRYAGTVELAGGTLAFGRRAVPTAGQLPAGMMFRFDASEAATLTTVLENGTNYVTKVANSASQLYNGKPFCLRPFGLKLGPEVQNDRRPYLLTNATPTGLSLMDFGPWCYWQHVYDPDTGADLGHPGRCFQFYSDDGQDTHLGALYLSTVIAVVDARWGGGWLLNAGFERAGVAATRTQGLLCAENLNDASYSLSANPRLTPTNGVVYIDGVRIPHPDTTGYNVGQQVIAMQIPGTTPDVLAGRANHTSGGVVLGEILAWNRPLSEREILDATAYLMRKWLGKTLAGYARDDDAEDMQNVIVKEASRFNVPADATARVARVTLQSDLVKDGDGVLAVGAVTGTDATGIRLTAGGIALGAEAHYPAALCEVAPGASLHFDPLNARLCETEEVGGKLRLTKYRDMSHALDLVYYYSTQYAPFYNYTEGPEAGGQRMPFVDFGTPGDEYGLPNAKSHALFFKRPLEGVRAVYAVFMARAGSRAFFMGSGTADYMGLLPDYRYDWHRGKGTDSTKDGPLLGSYAAQAIRGGVCLKNGEAFDPLTWAPPEDEWNLIEFHTLAGVHISALAADRGGSRVGGLGYGEVIVYERELTPAERVATRNYLRKKWFGVADEALTPLPAANVFTNVVASLTVSEGSQLAVSGLLSSQALVGSGDWTKTGPGTLTLAETAGYTGTLHVAAGTLRLSGKAPVTDATLPTDGLTLQLDAHTGLTTEVNDSRIEVTSWADARTAEGWKAVSAKGTYYSQDGTSSLAINSNPTLVSDETLGNRPAVDMAASSTKKYECFRFQDAAGNFTAIKDIKTVLWVLGSHNGGGFLLGGGDPSGTWVDPDGNVSAAGTTRYYFWHRGAHASDSQSSGRASIDAILCGSGSVWPRTYAAWCVNETLLDSVTAEDTLSGGWDLVSCRFNEGKFGAADGLAYDGRIFNAEDYRMRCGNQRLAEVLVYSKRLSDEELKRAEEYLSVKWGLNGYVSKVADAISAEVGAGAVLETVGSGQRFKALSGAGCVKGTVAAEKLVADFAADATLTVDGTFNIPSNVVFELRNVPLKGPFPAQAQVLSATAFSGKTQFESYTDDVVAPGVYFKPRLVGNALCVRASMAGMTLYFR